jgi:hypothetical protein
MMPRGPLVAGFAYFVVALGWGFVLGALRELVVAPRLGGFAAVALEVPIMLAISWIAARALVRILTVPATVTARLSMGLFALVLLEIAEVALAAWLGTPIDTFVAALATAKGALGLTAQVIYALIPLALRRT